MIQVVCWSGAKEIRYCIDSHRRVLYYKPTRDSHWMQPGIRNIIDDHSAMKLEERYNTLEEFIANHFDEFL